MALSVKLGKILGNWQEMTDSFVFWQCRKVLPGRKDRIHLRRHKQHAIGNYRQDPPSQIQVDPLVLSL